MHFADALSILSVVVLTTMTKNPDKMGEHYLNRKSDWGKV